MSAGRERVVVAPGPGRMARLGLVGCGRLAQHGYIPAMGRAVGVRLVAVADLDPSRCETVAPGVPAYPNARALLAAGGIDALIISTPTAAHLADARHAAEARLPALVEKPPGVDAGEAAALAALDRPPWIGFNRRFEPAMAQLRTDLPADAYFDLALELNYRRSSWKPLRTRDDALLDLGPHLVDLARWLTRTEVTRGRAISIDHRKAAFEVVLERGRARMACTSNRTYAERIEVCDGGGRVLARYARGGLVSGLLARLQPGRERPLVATLARQLEAFARAVHGGDASPLATAADGLAVMTAIDAVRRSAVEGGRWCPMEISGRAS